MSRSGLPSYYEWLAGLPDWVRVIVIEEMSVWTDTDQELLEEALEKEEHP